MNEWLAFSLILFGIWLIIFALKKKLRKEMIYVSLFTMLFGLTEPLFVPVYWNPPSLFNLASKTGFDIESFIFSFAVGGIGAVLYNAFFQVRQLKMKKHEMKKHRFHKLALFSPAIIFMPLIFTNLNPIYTASIAMLIGGVATMLCRPDLKKNLFFGGILFLALYFIFFFGINLAYPGFVAWVWNLSAISGILILGVPLEELIFAFTFGLLWAGIYEHMMWIKERNI